ncbi:MAG TPA: hypothetical protein VK034_18770, partial [Enhygromyxa sp.]|nr:hypothetical protein [Enhygromyxa sp.]
GSAWLEFRALGRLVRGPIRTGIVRSGLGPGGALARNVVEQIGRSKGDGVIHFSDAGHRSELFGGVIELDSLDQGGAALELPPAADVAIWPAGERRLAAAVAESAEAIAAVQGEARRARGWPRTVEVTIDPGERVFVVERDGSPSIIAAVDPRRWVAIKRGLIVGFIVAELALAAACTTAILWPPLFDWISMLGAGAALGLFLGVQPIGVAVSDAVRTPDRAYLRGRWG